MNLKAIYNKLFVGGKWYVAYSNIKDGSKEFKIVQTPPDTWIADPFLFETNGKHYLFVEQYFNKKKRAGLSAYEFIDGNPHYLGCVIENDYHMSYPCVFKYKDDIFIIPESSANETIDLYRASNFPLDWVHEKVLIKGERFVDTTIYFKGNQTLLLTYKKSGSNWKIVVFDFNIENRSLNKICEKTYTRNVGRPAGFLFFDGQLYRPSQNCVVKYGELIIVNKVTSLREDEFEEEYSYEIKASEIKTTKKCQRVHTINRDSEYEVVDLFEQRIDLLHALKIFKRAYVK